MARAAAAKVICFSCRQTHCACVASLNGDHRWDARPRLFRSGKARAIACLGGACVAGTALGAAIALLIGG
jgi:hypothetical protein